MLCVIAAYIVHRLALPIYHPPLALRPSLAELPAKARRGRSRLTPNRSAPIARPTRVTGIRQALRVHSGYPARLLALGADYARGMKDPGGSPLDRENLLPYGFHAKPQIFDKDGPGTVVGWTGMAMTLIGF